MIRSRRAGNVTRIEKRRSAYRVFVGRPEETRPIERSRRRWIFKKRDAKARAGLIWLRIRKAGGPL